MIRPVIKLSLLGSISIFLFSALSFAEEIKLTTIIPSSSAIRADKEYVGTGYASFDMSTLSSGDLYVRHLLKLGGPGEIGALRITSSLSTINQQYMYPFEQAINIINFSGVQGFLGGICWSDSSSPDNTPVWTIARHTRTDLGLSRSWDDLNFFYGNTSDRGLVLHSDGGVEVNSYVEASSTMGAKFYVYGSSYFDGAVSVGSFTDRSSDIRYKKNISTLPAGSLNKLLLLRGVSFEWRKDEFKDKGFPDGKKIGMIAQEIEKEFPELINVDEKGYKGLAYDKFTAVLLEGIKELKAENDALKVEFKVKTSDLEKRVEALEKGKN